MLDCDFDSKGKIFHVVPADDHPHYNVARKFGKLWKLGGCFVGMGWRVEVGGVGFGASLIRTSFHADKSSCTSCALPGGISRNVYVRQQDFGF